MKTKKYLSIFLVLIIISTVIASIGATYAVWTGDGGTDTTIPNVSTSNSAPWEKYFRYQQIGTTDTYAIVGWKGITTYSDVVFPTVTPNGAKDRNGTAVASGKAVVEIRNTLLENNEFTAIPTTITIPSSITLIENSAFQNLTNLKKVSFIGSAATIVLGDFAFANCKRLSVVTVQSGITLTNSETTFAGCIYQPI